MTTPLFSINAAAEILERDRRTITKSLRHTPPDGKENNQPRWRLKTILEALAAMQPAPAAAPTGQIDPELAELYLRFDASEATMKKLKTVDARRKASRAMAPLLAQIDAQARRSGLDNGVDPELVELRADRLFQIYLRGFESCNDWNHDEAWQAMDIRE
jgi:hypothetical protein